MLPTIRANLLNIYNKKLDAFLSLCESEIEKLFLLHYIHYWESTFSYNEEGLIFTYDAPFETGEYRPVIGNALGLGMVPYSLKVLTYPGEIILTPQYPLTINEKSYRLDFLFEIKNKDKPSTRVCIECDGYDYHHKNVQQVNRDYVRNKELESYGYYVRRYTGSQINAIRTFEDFEAIMADLMLMDIEPSKREAYLEWDRNRGIQK